MLINMGRGKRRLTKDGRARLLAVSSGLGEGRLRGALTWAATAAGAEVQELEEAYAAAPNDAELNLVAAQRRYEVNTLTNALEWLNILDDPALADDRAVSEAELKAVMIESRNCYPNVNFDAVVAAAKRFYAPIVEKKKKGRRPILSWAELERALKKLGKVSPPLTIERTSDGVVIIGEKGRRPTHPPHGKTDGTSIVRNILIDLERNALSGRQVEALYALV